MGEEKVLKILMLEDEGDAAVTKALKKQKIEKLKLDSGGELRNQNEVLLKENSELNNLIHKISQNVRDPLVAIQGLLHLAKQDGENQGVQTLYDSMESNIKNLNETVSQIHTLSTNAINEIKVSKIDWTEIIDTSLYRLDTMGRGNNINKFLALQTEFPFYSDELRLKEVMAILFSNAIQFQDKTRELLVGIEIINTPQEAQVIIKDNGIGIPDNILPRIFDVFYKGSEVTKGSGLGLYVAKSIVEKLEGRIEVMSILGKGSTVKMIIPNVTPPSFGNV